MRVILQVCYNRRMSVRFLHLADVHLGNDQYHSSVREKDMFEAFLDSIERHAIQNRVDFVAIAGDLFDKRSISPLTMNRAIYAFQRCQEAGIPVVAIEGNHDRASHSQPVSWLRCLSDWRYLHLLSPEEDMSLLPWDPETNRGGYLDIKGCRIIGSRWFGASTPNAIPLLAQAIEKLPPCDSQVLLLHAGIEGKVPRLMGGIPVSVFSPLREAGIDYLALGHIHQRYDDNGWIFNPGSLEACNVIESEVERGAYLVEIEKGALKTTFLSDQRQRPFIRKSVELTPFENPKDALVGILAALKPVQSPLEPVFELTMTGILNFPRHEINSAELEKVIQERYQPIVTLIKSTAVPRDLAIAPDAEHVSRQELERQLLQRLVMQDGRYQAHADASLEALMALKEAALSGMDPESMMDILAGWEASCES